MVNVAAAFAGPPTAAPTFSPACQDASKADLIKAATALGVPAFYLTLINDCRQLLPFASYYGGCTNPAISTNCCKACAEAATSRAPTAPTASTGNGESVQICFRACAHTITFRSSPAFRAPFSLPSFRLARRCIRALDLLSDYFSDMVIL